MALTKTCSQWVLLTVTLASLIACSQTAPQAPQPASDNNPYPNTPRDNVSDSYAGQQVADPYRWLENISDPATQQWVAQQRQFTQQQLQQLSARQFVKQRVTQLFNVQQTTAPAEHGDKLFYWHNDGLQDQPVLYVQDDLESPPRVVVDPNKLGTNGDTAVVDYSVSPNGQYLAFALSKNGSDWRQWRIQNLASGKTLAVTIRGTKFTPLSWYPDSKGFYYSRYPQTDNGYDDSQHVSVYYHRLGQPLAEDIKVDVPKDLATANPYPEVTEDGQYLLLKVQASINDSQFYSRPLAQPDADFQPLLGELQGDSKYLGSYADKLYFFNSGDNTGSVVAIAPNDSAKASIIVPSTDKVLSSAHLFGDQIIAHYLDSVQSRVVMFNASGEFLRELALPGLGSVSGFAGAADASQTFFKFSSFTEPGKIYRYQVAPQRTTLWRQSSLPIDNSRYNTQQVLVEASDKVQVPMFIVSSNQAQQQEPRPMLLHAYGGFGFSLTPHYNAKLMAWLELGGSLAIVNVRGGGEKGATWHSAGQRANKPNAVSDLLDSAEWLVNNGYTTPQQLALYGRGHGAMLVTSAMLAAPKQFAAAVSAVGLYDLLRYQHANANARSWQSEFGISSNSEDVKTLLSYSPLHNVSAQTCYPAMLISTGTRDQRVAPWHSYKFAATLQQAQGCDAPVLLQAKSAAGHGDKNPTWMQVEQATEQWLFLVNQLKFNWLKNSQGQ